MRRKNRLLVRRKGNFVSYKKGHFSIWKNGVRVEVRQTTRHPKKEEKKESGTFSCPYIPIRGIYL